MNELPLSKYVVGCYSLEH